MGTKVNQKARILEAASRIVGQAGAAHLTIEAVAVEAGLSKGGVLYHFPNKRSMLEGMLDKVLTDVGQRTAGYRDKLGDAPGAAIRARLLAEQEQSAQERAMSLALLAAAAEIRACWIRRGEFVSMAFAGIRDAARRCGRRRRISGADPAAGGGGTALSGDAGTVAAFRRAEGSASPAAAVSVAETTLSESPA